MNKTISLFSILLFSSFSALSGALEPEDFAQALILEVDGSTAIYEVSLPASVYENVVDEQLADVRVFNARQELVSHALRMPELSMETETAQLLPFFPLYAEIDPNTELEFSRADDGSILSLQQRGTVINAENVDIEKYIVDLSGVEDKIDSLIFELVGGAENFVKKLSIEQSRDLNHWRQLVKQGTLTQLQYGEHQLRENRIKLPRHYERYLRLSWHDYKDGIQLASVSGLVKTSETSAGRQWLLRPGQALEDEAHTYQFDTGGSFPLEAFNLVLNEENTLLEAELSSRKSESNNWQPQYAGLFHKLQVEGKQLKNDNVQLKNLSDHRYWKLTVKTPDGLGSVPPGFRFGWRGHKLVFVARGPAPFMLAFGSARAGPAQKPVSTLLDVLKREDTSGLVKQASISGREELSGAAALEKHFDISWQRTLLWIVLLGGVLILAYMAFRLLRQMQ